MVAAAMANPVADPESVTGDAGEGLSFGVEARGGVEQWQEEAELLQSLPDHARIQRPDSHKVLMVIPVYNSPGGANDRRTRFLLLSHGAASYHRSVVS